MGPRGGGWGALWGLSPGRVSQKPPGRRLGAQPGVGLRSPREGGSVLGGSLRSPRAAVRTRALSGCLLVYASSAGSCAVRKDRPSRDLRLRTRPISSHFLRSVWNEGQRMARPVSCHLPLREGPQSPVGSGLAQRGLLPQRLPSLASCFLTAQTTSVSSKGSIPCLFVSNVLNVC